MRFIILTLAFGVTILLPILDTLVAIEFMRLEVTSVAGKAFIHLIALILTNAAAVVILLAAIIGVLVAPRTTTPVDPANV